jgi:hypothetical protein
VPLDSAVTGVQKRFRIGGDLFGVMLQLIG